jgi:hypothetical protein
MLVGGMKWPMFLIGRHTLEAYFLWRSSRSRQDEMACNAGLQPLGSQALPSSKKIRRDSAVEAADGGLKAMLRQRLRSMPQYGVTHQDTPRCYTPAGCW